MTLDPHTTMNTTPITRSLLIALFLAQSLFSIGCAHKDRLHEFETRGATLSVDAPVAPLPDVILVQDAPLEHPDNSPLENLILATPRIINSTRAELSQIRLDKAAKEVDVALLVAHGILDRSEYELGMIPTDRIDRSDFTMTVDINHHGVSTARGLIFFLNAHVALYDNHSENRIWVRDVEITKQIEEAGLFRNLKATKQLNDMSKAELIELLEMISDYTAEGIVNVLKESMAGYG